MLARHVGAQAYSNALRSGEPATCPYDPEASCDPLDDIRMTAWYDGLASAQAQEEGPAFKIQGTRTQVTAVTEHDDGTITYANPASKIAGKH